MNSDWATPFVPDEHTVVLYHFDEGQGNETHDACGDPELTLCARVPLWGHRAGFGATARFTRTLDDANLFIGPANNDKLELRTCTKELTMEAWVRFTGEWGLDAGRTYGHICGTDEEGFSLPGGKRTGWSFGLGTGNVPEWSKGGLAATPRYLGPKGGVSAVSVRGPTEGYTGARPSAIHDQEWHHVAAQFRYADQAHFIYLDGRLVWKYERPEGRLVFSDIVRCDIPFHVGGFIHSQDPPFYRGWGNFEGEICEIRISDIMRYPVAEQLTIVHTDIPVAGLAASYSVQLAADAAQGGVTWHAVGGHLPKGLHLDGDRGTIVGTPEQESEPASFCIRAADRAGYQDEYTFAMAVRRGRIETMSLPVAFVSLEYQHILGTRYMVAPVRWRVDHGALPAGIRLDPHTGELSGVPIRVGNASVCIEAIDANGQTDSVELSLKAVPTELRRVGPDEHTVALWDWQGQSFRLIRDIMGDDELTLRWVNMMGDSRQPRPGWGRYPRLVGGGEGGFYGPRHNDKIDLRTCKVEWTVEAWVRRGGPYNIYHGILRGGDPANVVDGTFGFGHICGTYDNTERGVWELYLSDHASPDGSMSPGVHFFGQEPEQVLEDLHPWKRPGGIVGDPMDAGIGDTEWHHVAWQYSYAEDLHQLFLDGNLIWELASPDGRRLINNRRHDAQFSVGSRLDGDADRGRGKFNWLGWGNFFGQIGEIRISSIRRY